MTSYYVWFSLFAIILFLIITDTSVSRAIELIGQLIRFQYEKIKWIVLHDPANPINRYFIWRRSMRLAAELMRELDDRAKRP